MSNCPLCNLDSETTAAPTKPPGFFRRTWQSVQWVFPAALLALIPKCPLCVAAYVALFTGIGISAATALWIQILMLVFCLGALAFLAANFIRHCAPSRRQRLARS